MRVLSRLWWLMLMLPLAMQTAHAQTQVGPASGIPPKIFYGSGAPTGVCNSSVNINLLYVDTTNDNMWVCTPSGYLEMGGGGGGGGIPYPSGTGIPTVSSGAWGATLAQPTSALVGVSDTQTLTNKSIAVSEITGLPAFPAGTIVGTSDTQTLTNKSIVGTEINSGLVGSQFGGTGLNSSTATGIPQLSSGTWSVSTTLPNGLNFGTPAGINLANGTAYPVSQIISALAALSGCGSSSNALSPAGNNCIAAGGGGGGGNQTVTTITSSATPAITSANGLQVITLSANATPTISGIAAGQRVTFQICQPSSGGPYTWTWPAAVHGGITIGTTASTCSMQSFNSFTGTTLVPESAGVINVAP